MFLKIKELGRTSNVVQCTSGLSWWIDHVVDILENFLQSQEILFWRTLIRRQTDFAMELGDLNLQGRTLSQQSQFSPVFLTLTVQLRHQDHCDCCLRQDVHVALVQFWEGTQMSGGQYREHRSPDMAVDVGLCAVVKRTGGLYSCMQWCVCVCV